MTAEQELDAALLAAYRRAGKEVGYWGNYFLRSVRKNGGLATVRKMLRPTNRRALHKGLQALVDAGRPDLSVEALVQRSPFASLFTADEIAEARSRLDKLPRAVFREPVPPEQNFPETVLENQSYVEGASRRVTVNAFERDPRARAACIRKHGFRCAACQMSFQDQYGDIGKGFIHVHHKKPLAATRAEYRIDPTKDLVPVCPNCHAMLHTSFPPLGIDELIEQLGKGDTEFRQR